MCFVWKFQFRHLFYFILFFQKTWQPLTSGNLLVLFFRMSWICILLQLTSTDRIIQKRNKKSVFPRRNGYIININHISRVSHWMNNIWNIDISTAIYKCIMVKLILKMEIEDLFKKYLSLFVWTCVCHEFFNLSLFI